MSDEKKEPAVTEAAEAKATTGAAEVLAYCGPTIKGVALQYTVFAGGLPAKLTKLAERNPVVKALIVPSEQLAEMRVKVEQDGSRENLLCKRAALIL